MQVLGPGVYIHKKVHKRTKTRAEPKRRSTLMLPKAIAKSQVDDEVPINSNKATNDHRLNDLQDNSKMSASLQHRSDFENAETDKRLIINKMTLMSGEMQLKNIDNAGAKQIVPHEDGSRRSPKHVIRDVNMPREPDCENKGTCISQAGSMGCESRAGEREDGLVREK